MLNSSHDHPKKIPQTKQEDMFLPKLLFKEKTKAESSFRVLYYGEAPRAIPFTWESRPGTPKHTFSDSSLPPLTPPPSYQFRPKSKSSWQQISKPNFLHTLFPAKKAHVTPSISSSSSSGSSSYSVPSTPLKPFNQRRCCFHGRSRSTLQFEVDGDGSAASPTSTLCFVCRMKKVKKAMLSIVGHGR